MYIPQVLEAIFSPVTTAYHAKTPSTLVCTLLATYLDLTLHAI